jgi:superfamily II DNA or RNA helicase
MGNENVHKLMNFSKVKFNGVFRTYQARVLDNVEKHNRDNKIHIVAAPGSGKTILGLELIRHFNSPTLVLSPSITIRQQWGSRFEENFIGKDDVVSEYFSYDLKKPKLITCVTYQALYAAINKLVKSIEDDEEEESEISDAEKTLDFGSFDLIKTIKQAGIRTICLDEAHHLRSEWQKALESFISSIQSEVTIIALTATPPYDSTPQEWEKYISICGEIDEEISTPQLVSQGTLCPHQDYIYFNYPTEKEMGILQKYEDKIKQCIDQIVTSPQFDLIIASSKLYERSDLMDEIILDAPKGFIAFLSLIQASGRSIPKSLVKLVSPSGKLPQFDTQIAETAFDFIINNPALFGEDSSKFIYDVIQVHGLIERKCVNFTTNEKMNRAIISSVGKLESIAQIVISESLALGPKLRMLILTDFIKRDLINLIGTNEPIENIGTVPIFETLRRQQIRDLNIAILSGSLVIVPQTIIPQLQELSDSLSIECTFWPIENSGFSEVVFTGSNKHKVTMLTKAFQKGLIQVMIGTKSLLGEGWDSPCINSVILASFVGTFMLSNQMRGRAIRIDPSQPNKTANIWHLVTIEPTHLLTKNIIKLIKSNLIRIEREAEGVDFEVMVRRFKTFYAPAYEADSIENGIQRLTFVKSPFTLENIKQINKQMITLANNRQGLSNRWKGILKDNASPEIIDVNEIPKKVVPVSFVFINLLNTLMLGILVQMIVRPLALAFIDAGEILAGIIGLIISLLLLVFFVGMLKDVLKVLSPKRTINTLGQCILHSLYDMGEIKSRKASFVIETDESENFIKCALVNASTYEKTIFAKAMSELLTYIDNPRYLLIKKSIFFVIPIKNYRQSYACPSIFASKREYVDIFEDHLHSQTGRFFIQYTRNEEGRKVLLKCRRRSYINQNEIFIKGKKVIKNKWE